RPNPHLPVLPTRRSSDLAMGATVGVVLPPFFIGAATPVAQLSTVIALTPGSLGIQEAGWAGALSFLGLDEASTALFVVGQRLVLDRKSTRLNSSHVKISY